MFLSTKLHGVTFRNYNVFFYAGRNEHKGIKCETRTYTRLERRKTKGTGIIKDTAGECYAWIIIFL